MKNSSSTWKAGWYVMGYEDVVSDQLAALTTSSLDLPVSTFVLHALLIIEQNYNTI
jgi:hypothetical protein